jgi:type IV pilus assembly protein PilW
MIRESAIRKRSTHREHGLSLLELLIALTIGLFLLAGVVVLVSGLRNTSTTQTQLTQLQDAERLSMTLLTDVIQSAGYYPNPTTYTSVTALPATPPFATAGQAVYGAWGGGGSNPDSISVQFATWQNDGILNCQGGSNTAGPSPTVYVNTFSLDTTTNQLQCSLNNGPAVGLVNGVQDMTILYGIDTSGGASCTDTYLNAAQVQAGNFWNSVCSVMVQLTFANPVNAAAPIQFSRVIDIQSRAD